MSHFADSEVFGYCAVASFRKKPPTLSKRVRTGQPFMGAHGATQLLEVINLVDVSNNNAIPDNRGQFSFNANGCKGIDFIYIPNQKCIQICVRYKRSV